MAYNFVRDDSVSTNSPCLGIDNAISIGMPLTLAARCKINRTNINSTIVGVQIAGGNQAYAIAVNSTNNSTFSIAVAGGVSSFHGTAAGRITVGVWQHVAIVFASTTSRSIYANGGTPSPFATAFTSPGIVTGVRIGARDNPNGTFNSPAVADIAEVGIWSASLNSNEISSLVAGVTPNQIRPQSLAFYAPLIREPVDFRGGFTLTNTNGATVSDHPRTYA
jgi:hypothetical protein